MGRVIPASRANDYFRLFTLNREMTTKTQTGEPDSTETNTLSNKPTIVKADTDPRANH